MRMNVYNTMTSECVIKIQKNPIRRAAFILCCLDSISELMSVSKRMHLSAA